MAVNSSVANIKIKSAKGWSNSHFRESLNGYAFILPFLALMFTFQIYVFFSGFVLALTDAQGINVGKFIGLANYIEILKYDKFWSSVWITFAYAGGCLITQIPVAFVLAFFLNSLPTKRIQSGLRAAFFVPVLVNSIIAAWLFRQLFNPDQGIMNWFLYVLGYTGHRIDWLQDSSLAIPMLIFVSFWQWTGFHMVYFVSQLQTIDTTLYEAAKIDGASPFQILTRITLPLMRPAVTYAVVTSTIGGLMMFEYAFMIWQGGTYGPASSGRTLLSFVFDFTFAQEFRLGYGTAAGWLVFVIVATVSAINLKFFGIGNANEE